MEGQQTQLVHKKGIQGLGGFWKKLRAKIAKRTEASRQQTRTTSTASTLIAAPHEQLSKTVHHKQKVTQQVTPSVVNSPDTAIASTPNPEMFEDITDPERRLEKARAIFQKYDLEFVPSEWVTAPRPQRERVKKDIRMRVRYTCHTCKTTFGHDRICISCQHRKCNNCIRYPPRKDHRHPARERQVPTRPIENRHNLQRLVVGDECTCHECQSKILVGATQCPNCRHKVCDRCLREALVTISTAPTSEPQISVEGKDTGALRTIS